MPAGKSARYEFVILALLFLFWGSVGLNRLGIGAIFPAIVPEFHLEGWQTGFLISGTSVTWAISSWVGGLLSDRHGRRKILLPAVGFVSLMTAAMGGAWNFLSMFVVRDLLGLGDGVGWSVGQATVNEESSPERRGINQAVFTVGYTLIGVGIGSLVITRLTVLLGWRWVFPLIGAATALIALALFFVMREPRARRAQTVDWRPALALLRDPSLAFITVAGCAVLAWLQVMVGYNTLYLTKLRQFSLEDAGIVGASWGFAGAAGQIVLPLISDRVGRRPVVFASAVVTAAALGLYIIGGYGMWPMRLLAGLCGFCGFGILPIVLATCVSESAPGELRGAALGMTNFFAVIIGTTLMPLVAGLLLDHAGLATVLSIAVIAQIAVAASMLMVKETAPRILARRAGPAGVAA
jgi:MFS family permease